MAIKHFTSNIENWYEAKIRKKMSLSKSMEKRKKKEEMKMMMKKETKLKIKFSFHLQQRKKWIKNVAIYKLTQKAKNGKVEKYQ